MREDQGLSMHEDEDIDSFGAEQPRLVSEGEENVFYQTIKLPGRHYG